MSTNLTVADVHWEQYKSLRQEAIELAQETRNIEAAVIGAIAGIYAWLFAAGLTNRAIWAIPTGLAIFGALRSLLMFYRIQTIARYLRMTETRMIPVGESPLCGWEWYRSAEGKKWHGRLSLVSFLLWPAILYVTAAFWNEPPITAAPKPIKWEIKVAGLQIQAEQPK